jgi:hypothetical protein
MGNGAKRWMVTAAVAIAFLTPALGADLPLAPETKSDPAQAPADPNPLAPPVAACLEWSDGCRICKRAADGQVSCSNVGIACVPKAVNCSTLDPPVR